MKTIILIIALLGLSLINFAQTINTEAVELLYKEINFYRVRNDLPKCILNETTVKAAERWGKFMMSKHIDDKNNSYYHSNDGPVEYRNPKTTSEIIHVLYFNHEPSTVEIVAGLVYGIARNPKNVIGWSQSPGHNAAMLQDIAKYFGASVYVEKKGGWWVVYGTVNFSCIK